MNNSTINVKNMIFHVLLNWRMVLIWMLVCAILANGYGIYKSLKANNSSIESLYSPTKSTKRDIEEAKSKLTEKEIADVENAIALCQVFEERIPEMKEDLQEFAAKQGDGLEETSVYDEKAKRIDDLYNVYYYRLTICDGMSDGQKKYFQSLLKYEDLMNDILNPPLNSEGVGAKGETNLDEVVYVHKKKILIGLFVGLFISCFISILGYALKPVVRVKENLSGDMNQTVFGTVWLRNSKKKFLGFFDKAIIKGFYGRESEYELSKRIEMLVAGICINMNKESIKKVFITGASPKADSVIKELKEKLGEKVTVENGECVVYNPESLKNMSEAESVLFVETAGDSRYEEIAKELELAEQSKVKVLGFVLVQN